MKTVTLFTKTARFSRKTATFHEKRSMSFWVITKYRSFVKERPTRITVDTNTSSEPTSCAVASRKGGVVTLVLSGRPFSSKLNVLFLSHWQPPPKGPDFQILSFRHTKFSKRNCLGSPHPPTRSTLPSTGNPGSATVSGYPWLF